MTSATIKQSPVGGIWSVKKQADNMEPCDLLAECYGDTFKCAEIAGG